MARRPTGRSRQRQSSSSRWVRSSLRHHLRQIFTHQRTTRRCGCSGRSVRDRERWRHGECVVQRLGPSPIGSDESASASSTSTARATGGRAHPPTGCGARSPVPARPGNCTCCRCRGESYDSRPNVDPAAVGPKTPTAGNTPRTIDTTANGSGVPPTANGVLINLTVAGPDCARLRRGMAERAVPGNVERQLLRGAEHRCHDRCRLRCQRVHPGDVEHRHRLPHRRHRLLPVDSRDKSPNFPSEGKFGDLLDGRNRVRPLREDLADGPSIHDPCGCCRR